jgi:hypothetical protein
MTVESLENITQDQFNQAESIVINLLRSAYPALDLRRGTVLRELLVRPAASFYALESERYTQLQQVSSLQLIAENPNTATTEDVNRILANFDMTQRAGSLAYGTAYIQLAFERTYLITTGFTLYTLDGLVYGVEQSYTIMATPDKTNPAQLQLFKKSDGTFYALLPVVSQAAGGAYNIPAGTTLNATNAFDGFVTAEAYTNFVSGVDPETINQLLARMPSAIAHRSFESRISIDSILRDPDQGNFGSVLYATSVLGYGDQGQLRDKHNSFGVAVGSRSDIYVRTFAAPFVLTLMKTATKVAPHTYQFTLEAAEAPGYYAIRAITDEDTVSSPTLTFESLPIVGTYTVLEVRSATGLGGSFHDINAANAVVETCGTVFQKSVITVQDVLDDTAASRVFKVELFTAPYLSDIQAYVDRFDVRNLKADYLVRTPFICLVGVRALVVPMPGATLDIPAIKTAIVNYINTRSYVNDLTESEILGVLYRYNVQKVDTSDNPLTGLQIKGILRDATGVLHTLVGHTLDLRSIASADKLLLPTTCVFGATEADINITVGAM